jgi:hypothetical protein
MSSLGAKKGLLWWHALVDGDLQALPGDATLTVLESQNIESDMFGDIIGDIPSGYLT